MDTIARPAAATTNPNAHFGRQYQLHLKHLRLKGLQPKTIDAYARAIRQLGDYFAHDIDALSERQLIDYFSDLIKTHSWSAVKLNLYGLKFYTIHVLRKPWAMPHLIKPPKAARLPDIVTVQEAQALFAATRTLSYRVFYFALYSLGLRRSKGLALRVGDIDGARSRVHIRHSKGNRDRLVPLPDATLGVLRKFWQILRHPELLFPNRAGGLSGAHNAITPLDRGGVQKTLRQVAQGCGLKKMICPQQQTPDRAVASGVDENCPRCNHCLGEAARGTALSVLRGADAHCANAG